MKIIKKLLNNLGVVSKNLAMGAGLTAVTIATGAVVYNVMSDGGQSSYSQPGKAPSAYSDSTRLGSNPYGVSDPSQYGSGLSGGATASLSAAKAGAARSDIGGRYAPSNAPVARGSSAQDGGEYGGGIEGMGVGRDAKAQSDMIASLNSQISDAQAQARAGSGAAGGSAGALADLNLGSAGSGRTSRAGGGSSYSPTAGKGSTSNQSDSSATRLASSQLNNLQNQDRARQGRGVGSFQNSDVSAGQSLSQRASGRQVRGAGTQADAIRKTLASADGKKVGAGFIGDTYQNAGQNAVGTEVGASSMEGQASDITLGEIAKTNKQKFEFLDIKEQEKKLRASRTNKAWAWTIAVVIASLAAFVTIGSLRLAPWLAWGVVLGAELAIGLNLTLNVFKKYGDGINLSNTTKAWMTGLMTVCSLGLLYSMISSTAAATSVYGFLAKIFGTKLGSAALLAGGGAAVKGVGGMAKGDTSGDSLQQAKLYNQTGGRMGEVPSNDDIVN